MELQGESLTITRVKRKTSFVVAFINLHLRYRLEEYDRVLKGTIQSMMMKRIYSQLRTNVNRDHSKDEIRALMDTDTYCRYI